MSTGADLGDRLIWNAREEEVLISALESISLIWKSDNGCRTGYLEQLENELQILCPDQNDDDKEMERAKKQTKVKEKSLPKNTPDTKAKPSTFGRNAVSIEAASKLSSKAKPKEYSIIARRKPTKSASDVPIQNRNTGSQALCRSRKVNRKPNDAFLDESDRIRRISSSNNRKLVKKRVKVHDSGTEKYTPMRKSVDRNSVSEKYNAEEKAESDPVRRTPPVEASMSPEIQFHSNLKPNSSAAPLCYGAGHLLSGVTDRRKCRRRGSLRGTANPNNTPFSATTDPVVSACEQVSVPLLCEASVNWLPSPNLNSWEHSGNIIQTPESDSGNRTTILPPSEEDPGSYFHSVPSSTQHQRNAGSSISSWESDATIDKNNTVKISWKDEQVICTNNKSDEFDRCCLDADSISPVMILDYEPVMISKKTNRKEGFDDPCAESFSTNGGSLIVSEDSTNWPYS